MAFAFLLRSLIPSWRFFDRVGGEVYWYVRFPENAHDDQAPWQPLFVKPAWHWTHYFLRPHGNFYLLNQSLAPRTMAELNLVAAKGDIAELVSLRQVQRLASEAQRPFYQLKISASESDTDDFLITPVYEL